MTHGRPRRLVLVGALLLNLAFGLVVNLVVFQTDLLRLLARNTAGWLSPTLVVNALGLCIIVGGWLVIFGRISPKSIGLDRSTLRYGLTFCAGTWIAIQAVAGIGRLASGQSLLEFSPGLTAALPVLFGQVAGNALYEEAFYRGYMIRALTPEVGGRSWAAVLLAAALFGVMHVANYLVRGLSMGLLVPATLAGVLFGFVYLRTRNLWLCIGLHSLLNVPTAIWDSSIPGFVVPALALFLCLGLGPGVQPRILGEASISK